MLNEPKVRIYPKIRIARRYGMSIQSATFIPIEIHSLRALSKIK